MIAATHTNHPLPGAPDVRSKEAFLHEACNRIRGAGMRVTKPRVALVEVLLKQEGPVSIERIHHEVGVDSCDLVTIYRCLAAFEDLGLVRRSYLHNGTCLYEQTFDTARRYHIVCKTCGKTDKVDYTLTGDAEQKLKDRGYEHVSHVLEFFGICPECQLAAKSPVRGTSVSVPTTISSPQV
jgi:Fur family transcriptional regulator, ferric uptake regulator